MPVDVPDALLLLLTVLLSGGLGAFALPRFARVTAAFVGATGFEAFRVVLGAALPGLSFSPTILARELVAATAAAFAGEGGLTGDTGFNGETGRARYDFCGEASIGRIGECGKVREFEDFGDSTLDGFVTCRLTPPGAVFVRFLGFGIGWLGSGVFSLSTSISSLILMSVMFSFQASYSGQRT